MASSPDADTAQGDTILFHLRQSFSKGDRNHEARFWYARQLCLMGRGGEAVPIFVGLKQLSVPLKQKRGVRGIVMEANGQPTSYYGQLYSKRPFYGFIRGDQDGLEAFVSSDEIDGGLDVMQTGQRVRYNLGFNLAGPVALLVFSN